MARSTDVRRDAEVELYPLLSYHYPGHTFWDWVEMPRWAVRMYLEDLPRLIAERQLLGFQVSAYPHMKRSNQRQVRRRWERKMRRGREHIVKPETEEQRHALARGIGIAVEEVKANA